MTKETFSVSVLRQAANVIEDRAVQRDQPGGEKSFKTTAEVLNIRLRDKLLQPLTGSDVALVLAELKRTRQMYGQYVEDDYTDEVAYTALRYEEKLQELAMEAANSPINKDSTVPKRRGPGRPRKNTRK